MTDRPLRYSIFSVQDHYPQRVAERDLATFYRQSLDQCVLAEQLGYDTFFVAEHHFHEYGAFPNPAVFLSAAATRTSRIRLGTAISALPFRHPMTVAEDYTMLDVLSGGRVVLGVGSGYLTHEFAGFGIDGAEKRERFDEALAALRPALRGERVTFEGKHVRLKDLAINVPPVQPGGPPIYVAVLRREAAYHVGRQGNRLMSVPYASVDRFEDVEALIGEFRRGGAEAGRAADDDDHVFAFHCHAAESDAAARRNAAEAFDLYVATRLYAKRQTYDDILASGLGLFGSVDTVAEKLARLHGWGIRHVMLLQNFGLLPAAAVEASMTTIAERVMPRLGELLAKRRAA
jgi:alkanesulfonate monooxygenase SsuD/methylene tetrahydromethanopterin reductase-like flavin-dependent oxidoreductase (luciferase family)